MRGVAEQDNPIGAPVLQRVAEVDRRDQRPVHQAEQFAQRRAGVGQGGVQVGQVARCGPRLAVHLGGGHERAQAVDAVRVPVVPQRVEQHVSARPEPGHDLRVVALRHLLPRYQATPHHDAGEPGLPLAHELPARRGTQAVRADQQVAAHLRTAGQFHPHVACGLLERDHAAAGAHAVGRQRHQQAGQQVGAVPAVVGLAVLRRPRLERPGGDDRVVAQAALLGNVDAGRRLPPVRVGAEVAQRLHGVRVQPEARADGGERGRLLEHQRLDARLPQGDGGGEPAGAAARDDHAHAAPLTQDKGRTERVRSTRRKPPAAASSGRPEVSGATVAATRCARPRRAPRTWPSPPSGRPPGTRPARRSRSRCRSSRSPGRRVPRTSR